MLRAERRARRLLYRHLPTWRGRLLYRLWREVLIPTDIGDFYITRRARSHSGPGIAIWPKGAPASFVGCVICGGDFRGETFPHSDHVLTLLLRIKADPLKFMRDVNWDHADTLDELTHFMERIEPVTAAGEFMNMTVYFEANAVYGTTVTTFIIQ